MFELHIDSLSMLDWLAPAFAGAFLFYLHNVAFLFHLCYNIFVTVVKQNIGGSLMTKRTINATILSEHERHLIEKKAERLLIGRQDCSKVKTEEYNHICFGEDLNVLDYCRKWLYVEERANGASYEHARISANKLVLYINEERLQAEVDRMIHESSAS